MEWIEQKLSDWRKATSDLSAVLESAEKIFNHLWEEILRITDATNEQGIAIITNGQPFSRTVTMLKKSRIGATAKNDRVLIITLSGNKRSIKAQWENQEITFSLEVCPDGVVCLKDGLFPVAIIDVAKRIMEPFLFGEGSPFSSHV